MNTRSQQKPLGVVVVGTSFGNRIHVPAARSAGLDVVALVGRDHDRTQRRAARSGVEHACVSLDQALRLPRADIVVIATPPATHAGLADEAIAAGRHVLVEKPFTTTVKDAKRIAEAAARAGVVALVGHEFRFTPERVTMRQALEQGLIGTPRLGTFVGHSSFAAPLDLRFPEWWFDPARGGGWLGAAVSHIIDAIRCWLGDFDTVSSSLPMVSARDGATMAEDTVSARFRLRSGCECVLQQSAATWGDPVQIMRVAGPNGTLSIEGQDVTFGDAGGVRPIEPAGPRLPVEATPSGDPRDRFTHLELGPAMVQASVLRDLVRGVNPEYDAVPPATFADGVACMEVIDAMRRSSAQDGAVVTIE